MFQILELSNVFLLDSFHSSVNKKNVLYELLVCKFTGTTLFYFPV